MPHLCSTTINKFKEFIQGPKTVDVEFDLKYEELKLVQRNIKIIKNLFDKFYRDTKGNKPIIGLFCFSFFS